MDDLTNGFRKWIGYIATGISALIFFGVTGWLALVFAGYFYLKHLWQQNPVSPEQPQQRAVVEQPPNTPETILETTTNHSRNVTRRSRRHRNNTVEFGKLPPNRVTPPRDQD